MCKLSMKIRWVLIILIGLVILLNSCWIKNIDTPYYEQVTSYYCGAAASQMILDSENLDIYIPSQHTIYNYIHSHNYATSGWASDPQGVREVLNYYANPTAYFRWDATTNQDQGVNLLAYTIDKYTVPPTVLIYHFAHWVVVRGVATDLQPTTNTSYTIYGFYVNDPWYGASSLGENTYIAIDEWKTNYFTTGSWTGSPGSPKYISVVDPKPVPKRKLFYPKVPQRRPYFFSSGEISYQADEMLNKVRSDKRFAKYFKKSMSIIKTARNSEPILVIRVDRKKDAYYIVPVVNDELRYRNQKETVGAILFDAYTGALKETSLLTQGISYEKFFNKDYAAKQILSKKNRVNLGLQGKVNIKNLQLVWKFNPKGPKAYYPYWKATGIVQGENKSKIIGYLNWDGKVMKSLPRKATKYILGG